MLCKGFKAFYFTTTTFFWRVLCCEVVVAKKGSPCILCIESCAYNVFYLQVMYIGCTLSTSHVGNARSTGQCVRRTFLPMCLCRIWTPARQAIFGLMSYTTPAHIVRAMLEGNVFLTHAVIESMKLDSNSELDHLKVDGP